MLPCQSQAVSPLIAVGEMVLNWSINRFGNHGHTLWVHGISWSSQLIGVIVSHVIVLFDFIEEMHEKGEPLERALPDAGIERIRPVMITVAATILALFPLA